MTATRLIALLLIVAGAAGLALGSFTYTEEKTALKAGPLEVKVQDKETVAIPMWLSGGVLGVGVVLLLAAGGRKR